MTAPSTDEEVSIDDNKAEGECSAQQTIVPGAVVRLKSGGPRMTVGSTGSDVTAECWWFTDAPTESYAAASVPQQLTFPVIALKLA